MTKILREIALDHSDHILERAQKGDEKAFSKLVGLWFKKIYNFCLKYFGDHDVAMESTQKTFIALHRHLPALREADKLKFWLFKVARNYCYEEARKNQRLVSVPLALNEEAAQQQDHYYHPERKLQAMEKEQWVSELLQRLPEEQRIVVIMKEYEDMKFKEIAQVLEVSENTVKSRLYYAFKSLRKQIEASGHLFKE